MFSIDKDASIKLIDSCVRIFERFGSTRLLGYSVLCATVVALMAHESVTESTLKMGLALIAGGFVSLVVAYWLRPHDPKRDQKGTNAPSAGDALKSVAILIMLGGLAFAATTLSAAQDKNGVYFEPTQVEYDSGHKAIGQQQDMYQTLKGQSKASFGAANYQDCLDKGTTALTYTLYHFQRGFLLQRMGLAVLELSAEKNDGDHATADLRRALKFFQKAAKEFEAETLGRYADYKKDGLAKAKRSIDGCNTALAVRESKS